MGQDGGVRFCDACGRTIAAGEQLAHVADSWVCPACLPGRPAPARRIGWAQAKLPVFGVLVIVVAGVIAMALHGGSADNPAGISPSPAGQAQSSECFGTSILPSPDEMDASEEQLLALKALQQLAARVEIGVNFRDYSAALADTWVAIKPHLEKRGGNALLATALRQTVEYYRTAADSWNQIVSPNNTDLQLKAEGYRLERLVMARRHSHQTTRQAAWGMARITLLMCEEIIAGNAEAVTAARAARAEMATALSARLAEHEAWGYGDSQ